MLKLHAFDRSPFGWKVRMALAEKGLPFETIVPQDKMNDPAFGKLNPFRLTPVLVLDDGRAIYESTAICEYLEDAHPLPALLPKDAYERARVRMLEDTSDQYFYPAVRAFLMAQFEMQPPHLVRKAADQVDHAQVEAGRGKIREHVTRLEAELRGRTWFGGETFSLADITLAPALTVTLPLVDILPSADCPEIARWSAAVRERPSYAASAPKVPFSIRG